MRLLQIIVLVSLLGMLAVGGCSSQQASEPGSRTA